MGWAADINQQMGVIIEEKAREGVTENGRLVQEPESIRNRGGRRTGEGAWKERGT